MARGAERMRRLRERRRRNVRVVHVEADDALIEALHNRGLLATEDAESQPALAFALAMLLEELIGAAEL